MKKEILLRVNYKIIKATDKVLAKIIKEVYNCSDALDIFGKLKEDWKVAIAKTLRVYNGKHLKSIKIYESHNLIPSVLRNSLATLISGTTVTPTFKANYVALGSGSTAPSNLDTQLETETLRATFTNRYSVANVAYLDKFFGSSEVGGNSYLEIGIFVDGTAVADTGYLLSRMAMDETMLANETLSVNASFTIT